MDSIEALTKIEELAAQAQGFKQQGNISPGTSCGWDVSEDTE